MSPQQVYVVGVTSSGRNGVDHPNLRQGAFPLTLSVTCGGESISTDGTPKSYQYLQELGVTVTITKEDVARLFIISEAGSHSSCYTTTFITCSDQTDCDSTKLEDTSATVHMKDNVLKISRNAVVP